jgi:hypothetical protein
MANAASTAGARIAPTSPSDIFLRMLTPVIAHRFQR